MDAKIYGFIYVSILIENSVEKLNKTLAELNKYCEEDEDRKKLEEEVRKKIEMLEKSKEIAPVQKKG